MMGVSAGRTVRLALIISALAGCRAHAPRVTPEDGGLLVPDSSVIVVVGESQHTAPEALRSGRGSLIVAVRRSSTPTAGIAGATVVVEGNGMQPVGVQANRDGVATLDSIPAGNRRLRVQRVGMVPYILPIAIRADCRQHVEVYLEAQMMCLFEPCRDTPPRATITTCPPTGPAERHR